MFINTKAMLDREYAEELNQKAEAMLKKYPPMAEATFAGVRARLK